MYDYDVIVVGAGVQGLSTARYLAKEGVATLLLDQYDIAHARGSSHGKTRGIRYTYSTYQHIEMLPEAFQGWFDLEKEERETLFINTGAVCLCDATERNETAKNLQRMNVDYELLGVGGEREPKWPGLNLCGSTGIYVNYSGILKADRCIQALKRSYFQAGGTFTKAFVKTIRPISPTEVKIITEKQSYKAKSVILTCGAWTNHILKPLDLHLPIMVKKVLNVYWKSTDPDVYSLKANFPLSCVMKPDCLVYALPMFEYPGHVKACNHDGVVLKHPDLKDKPLSVSQLSRESMQLKRLKEVVAEHYPYLTPEPANIETCLYSMTPDEDFILDRHPSHKNIIIGAGFSGHGFKMAPVIGAILSNIALRRPIKYSLKPFSLKRFHTNANL